MIRPGAGRGSLRSLSHGLPIFDSHLHIVDPTFPLSPNRGFLPKPFLVADYREAVCDMEVVGGAVVAGSFQGHDTLYLESALAELGPGFVGVASLPEDVSDREISRLDALGARAVRFNLFRGSDLELAGIARLAQRVHDVAGWHAELYVDAADLPELKPMLASIPRIVIDHLGLSRAGLPHLLRLVSEGAWVKASGFGRLDYDADEAIVRIYGENPGALLFGTDLPSTRAARPYSARDLDSIARTLGTGASLERVLYDNAVTLYRPAQRAPF